MAGWQDWLFSNLPRPPQHPASHGSAFGMTYQALPTSPNIEDRRNGVVAPGFADAQGADPKDVPSMSDAPDLANPTAADPGAYSPSFPQNFAPPPAGWQMPARPAQPPLTTLPYIDPHQPIAPGPPGWSPHGDSPAWSPFTPEQMQSALRQWQGGR
jgi:hypothetical protein